MSAPHSAASTRRNCRGPPRGFVEMVVLVGAIRSRRCAQGFARARARRARAREAIGIAGGLVASKRQARADGASPPRSQNGTTNGRAGPASADASFALGEGGVRARSAPAPKPRADQARRRRAGVPSLADDCERLAVPESADQRAATASQNADKLLADTFGFMIAALCYVPRDHGGAAPAVRRPRYRHRRQAAPGSRALHAGDRDLRSRARRSAAERGPLAQGPEIDRKLSLRASVTSELNAARYGIVGAPERRARAWRRRCGQQRAQAVRAPDARGQRHHARVSVHASHEQPRIGRHL